MGIFFFFFFFSNSNRDMVLKFIPYALLEIVEIRSYHAFTTVMMHHCCSTNAYDFKHVMQSIHCIWMLCLKQAF